MVGFIEAGLVCEALGYSLRLHWSQQNIIDWEIDVETSSSQLWGLESLPSIRCHLMSVRATPSYTIFFSSPHRVEGATGGLRLSYKKDGSPICEASTS